MSGGRYIQVGGLFLLGLVLLMSGCVGARYSQQPKQVRSAEEYFMLGQRMKLQHRPKEAIGYFKAFQKLKPRNATVYFEIARQYNNLRQQDSVLVYAEKAAALDSANKWIQQFYARTLAERKQFEAAAEIFHRLSERYPYSADFVFQEALMLFYSERYEEALPLFDSLEKQKGTNEELVFQKQRIYVKMHQIDSAAGEIQKLITQDPGNDRYYALLAKMYAKNNEPQQAVNVYKDLLKKQPENPQAQLALGILYKQMDSTGKFKKYTKIAFVNPAFPLEKKIEFIYPFLKYVEVDSTEQADAIWLCRLLTEIHKQDPRAYALFGDMLFKCKQPDSALFQYKKALQYKKARYEVWNQIMLIYAQKGNIDSLMAYSKKAVHHFPNNAKARYFNGIAYFFKGKNENAASELQQALQIGIKNTKLKGYIYKSLTNIYLQLNNRREATKYKRLAENLQEAEEKKQRPKNF